MAYLTEVAIMLVDGENLATRYGAMVKEGKQPLPDVEYVKDKFVWAPKLGFMADGTLRRITYFSTTNEANPRTCSLWKTIAAVSYTGGGVNRKVYGSLHPYILKRRRSKDEKDKILDIHLTVEALRVAHTKSADEITIVSGDSDYVVVVEEVRRLGPKIRVLSLSSGISDDLKLAADYYECIDHCFFVPE